MLSKIEFLVLGLIAEKPLNPYEIVKLLELLNIKKAVPMSPSSVYATVNRMVKKAYISGTRVKSGNMPEKTVYSVTESGTKKLEVTLGKYLGEPEKSFTEFDIAIIFTCHLTKDEAIETLERHRDKVKSIIDHRNKQDMVLEDKSAHPYTGLIMRRHYVYKREAELRTINELIDNIAKDPSWDHFPALKLQF